MNKKICPTKECYGIISVPTTAWEGVESAPPPLLSLEPMVISSPARRRSKALHKTQDLPKAYLTLAHTWGDATPFPQSFSWLHATFFCDRRLMFCIAYFLTFLHKVCKWQVSMTFRCRAMTLFSRSYHGPFDANAHCCGSFWLFFNICDESSLL